MLSPRPLLCLATLAFAGGCFHAPRPGKTAAGTTEFTVPTQIITPHTDGTPDELFQRGEEAIRLQRWSDAIATFEVLKTADGDSNRAPVVCFDLAIAYEGAGLREDAAKAYHDVESRFPGDARAKVALIRAARIHAYGEEWGELFTTALALLKRSDIDSIDRMTALGARGLSLIETGDDTGASRDVQNGLDVVEALRFGAANRLPWAVAQLEFALGEIRRTRSERIHFIPITKDFLRQIETRCQLLLDAQSAYADAIRSTDPEWAAMSGSRIGEMYQAIHRDLMAIPPTDVARTPHQRLVFFGIMHVRYRALLEKGLEMMVRTLAFAEKMGLDSSWTMRAAQSKREMESALSTEKETLARSEYSEAEFERALELMQEKMQKKRPH